MVEHALAAAIHAAAVAATTTTVHSTSAKGAAKPATSHVTALEFYLVEAASFAIGAGIAYYRRRRRGIYPWRLNPLLWGLIFLIGSPIIALPLIAVAWKFSPSSDDPNVNPGRQRNVFRSGQWQQHSGPPDEESPARFAPGTYGTSLPPHERAKATSPGRSVDSSAEPAGWLTDPSGRHQYRYWDGGDWTRHVADHGRRSSDPM